MTMQVKYEDGRVSFNLSDMLDHLSTDDKRYLIDHLACQDDVIDFVSQQIVERWTEMGSHGPHCCTAEQEPRRGLDKAWRAVAKASGDVAKSEIERLERALQYTEERLRAQEKIVDEYRRTYRMSY